MLELYQYDMNEYWPQTLNLHGEYGFAVDRYLRNPLLKAYFFLVDDSYAGFALVDPDVIFPDSKFCMGQFFVMNRYRRVGVGTQAARFVFDQFRGRWEVGQRRLNLPSQVFWRRTIAEYTNGEFVEHDLRHERLDGILQCFDNSARK